MRLGERAASVPGNVVGEWSIAICSRVLVLRDLFLARFATLPARWSKAGALCRSPRGRAAWTLIHMSSEALKREAGSIKYHTLALFLHAPSTLYYRFQKHLAINRLWHSHNKIKNTFSSERLLDDWIGSNITRIIYNEKVISWKKNRNWSAKANLVWVSSINYVAFSTRAVAKTADWWINVCALPFSSGGSNIRHVAAVEQGMKT